jgi:hypothetical protein
MAREERSCLSRPNLFQMSPKFTGTRVPVRADSRMARLTATAFTASWPSTTGRPWPRTAWVNCSTVMSYGCRRSAARQ